MKTTKSQISKIKELIASADGIPPAIEILKNLVQSNPILDDVLMQQGKLSDLEKSIIHGVLKQDEIDIKKNEIRSSLLRIVRLISDKIDEDEKLSVLFQEISIGNQFDFSITLNDWIKSRRGLTIVLFFIVLIVIYLVLVIMSSFPGILTEHQLKLSGLGITFAFILFSIYYTTRYKCFDFDVNTKRFFANELGYWKRLRIWRPTEKHPDSEEEFNSYIERFKVAGNKALVQFIYFWFWLWFSWIGLILVLGYQEYYEIKEYSLGIEYFKNLFNSLNTLMFIYLYLNITISTSRISEVIWVIFAIVVVGLLSLHPVMMSSIDDQSMKLSAEFSFQLSISLISSLTLMALLGRLSGKFMNIPILIMLVLYSYVLYQLVYPFLGYSEIRLVGDGNADDLPMSLAFKNLLFYSLFFSLIVKSILFSVITWLLDSGKMLYFIAEESSLNFEDNNNFKRFLYSVPIKEDKIFRG